MGLRIIFAGTPDFSVSCLQTLLDSSHQVCAVYTQPDRKAGRGRKLQASPVKQCAQQANIPVYQPQNFKADTDQQILKDHNADLMVVVAYGLLLPQVILDAPKFGCVNVHASLLPRWRGAAPIQRAIAAGDKKTGVCLMQMDAGLDTGAVLLQQECDISPDETGQSLHDKLAIIGAKVLRQGLDNWTQQQAQPQTETGAVYAHKLNKAEAKLDWTQSAVALDRQIRAYNPYPVVQMQINDLSLRIWQAQVVMLDKDLSTYQAGDIIQANKQGLDMMTADGVLRLLEVQQAGKKRVKIADFINSTLINSKYI